MKTKFRGIQRPSPMESATISTVCDISEQNLSSPGSGNEKEKRNRFEQTSRTLQSRKISMRSTKDQLY
ncbi:hypothetical protein TNCV_406291 [Trichonephila clavipes]|nr:hypothetical protein TNCV_406291 [Trichonephila clavipes]